MTKEHYPEADDRTDPTQGLTLNTAAQGFLQSGQGSTLTFTGQLRALDQEALTH